MPRDYDLGLEREPFVDGPCLVVRRFGQKRAGLAPTDPKKEYGGRRAYRPLLLEPLAQALKGKTCLSLTSRAVSS
jgi:hypothetical protein